MRSLWVLSSVSLLALSQCSLYPVRAAASEEGHWDADEGALQNSQIRLMLNASGQPQMRRQADGKWLLFPGWTSAFSVNVDGEAYWNVERKLSLSVATPLRQDQDGAVSVSYNVNDGVVVIQQFSLEGPSAKFHVVARNTDDKPHSVKVRYLFDTQVDENDGSPLYAPGVGVKTHEEEFTSVSFSEWMGYDKIPEPSLVSVGTLETIPYRMVFAHWPEAIDTEWEYEASPSRRFYTPGELTSPESDSCVLLYFDLGTLAPGQTGECVTYYGIGKPEAIFSNAALVSALESLRESVKYKLDTDLHNLALVQARAYKVIFNSKEFQALDIGDVTGITANAVQGVIEAQLGHAADAAFSLALIPVKIGKDAFFGELNRNRALEALAKHFHHFYQARIDPDKDVEPIAQEIEKLLPNLQEMGLRDKSEKALKGVDELIERTKRTELVSDYPSEEVLVNLKRQSELLRSSVVREETLIWPNAKEGVLFFRKIGTLANYLKMSEKAEAWETAEETAEAAAFGTTVVAAGAVGLKIALVIISSGATGVVEVMATALSVASLTLDTTADIIDLSSDEIQTALGIMSFQAWANEVDVPIASSEDALQYVNVASPEGKDYDLQILSLSAEDVVLRERESSVGVGKGTITITNSGPHAAKVNYFIEAVGPTSSNRTLLAAGSPNTALVIAPGEEKELQFRYSAPAGKIWNSCDMYTLKVWLAVGTEDILLEQTGFAAGSARACEVTNLQEYKNIVIGEIRHGESSRQQFSVLANATATKLYLTYEGSDLDLHLYDGENHHVGLNYDTGQLDRGIPGVAYSGSNVQEEWMTIEGHQGEQFDVGVVAVVADQPEKFIVSAVSIPQETPALLAVKPSKADIVLSEGRDRAVFRISEIGGYKGVSDLVVQVVESDSPTGVLGHTLSATEILAGGNADLVTTFSTTGRPQTAYSAKIRVAGKEKTTGNSVETHLSLSARYESQPTGLQVEAVQALPFCGKQISPSALGSSGLPMST